MNFVTNRFDKEDLQIFDSYRGLLAVLVVLAHLNQIIWVSILGQGMLSSIFGVIANTSVVIFFLLSGILITYSGINLTNQDGFDFKKFFINRFTRIYPTLLFSLVLIYLLMRAFFILNHNSYVIPKLSGELYLARDTFYAAPLQMLRTLFFVISDIINVNGPMWSLFIEWWLYMAAIFVFMALKGRYNLLIKVILFFISLLPLYYICKLFPVTGIFYIIIWFMGFFYTTVIRGNKSLEQILLAISILIVCVLIYFRGFLVFDIDAIAPVYYGFIQILYTLFFLNFFRKTTIIHFFKRCASFSYTLYLIHFPIIVFVHSLLKASLNLNIYYTVAETTFDFVFVMILSYYVSKITENKDFFRKILHEPLKKIPMALIGNSSSKLTKSH